MSSDGFGQSKFRHTTNASVQGGTVQIISQSIGGPCGTLGAIGADPSGTLESKCRSRWHVIQSRS